MYYGCCFLLFLSNTKKYTVLLCTALNLLQQCELIKY